MTTLDSERREVTCLFGNSPFTLTHPFVSPQHPLPRFHVVGRRGSAVEGVNLRFDSLGEAQAILREVPAHAQMPGTLAYAAEARCFNGAVLSGYSAVRCVFQQHPLGARRINLLAIARAGEVREAMLGDWLTGARAYLAGFWQRVVLETGPAEMQGVAAD